jgi:ubiquitin C-terminal hydrolase
VSFSVSHDLLIKIYIPPNARKQVTLKDLLDYNFNTTFNEALVNCGKCGVKTNQKSTKEIASDLICLEFIRVTQKVHGGQRFWRKNDISILFPTNGIVFPGSSRKYRVIGACHHIGSIISGHWFTKVVTIDIF